MLLHIDKLRAGEGEEQYRVVEESGLPRWGPDATLRTVGQPCARVEGDEKVTGRARYAYDVRLPGMLFARVLRSPHPHARIKRLDASKAAALPGVGAVVHANNTPEIKWYQESWLFDRTLRFVGDEVAAVAADSEEIAEDALRLIEVEYEPLPFVADLEAALRPDAPKVHGHGNVAAEPKLYQRGDVEAALRSAAVVVDQTYTTQAALHNCMEPHGCTAFWQQDAFGARSGELTIWDSTQSVFSVREELAEKLKSAAGPGGMPEHRVRVIKQYMGGGFGSKQVAWKHAAIAALLSQRARRPVQLMLDREAENLAVGNRNATRQRVRLAAKEDGTLTAIDAQIHQNAGAYMVGGEGSNVAGAYQRLYRCPNVRTEQTPVYTNLGPAVAFRAPGFVEGAFALEQAIDELARRLGMDPLELRLRNYADGDQQKGRPYTAPDALRVCYERAAEAFGWRERQRDGAKKPPGRPSSSRAVKARGVGMAAHDWGGSGFPPGYAWVKLNQDGSVEVVTGTQDIGTGTRTALTQVAAEELSVPAERVRVHLGDTAYGPYAPPSAGSATQATIGPAVRAAAADARAQLLQAAADILEASAEELRLEDGEIFVADEPRRRIAYDEVTKRIGPHMIQGHGARGPNPEGKSVRTFGAQMVEVEVDVETGEVTLLRVVASHDCGRVINPRMVDSQVVGGVTQGIGYALTEERIVDVGRGVVLNANLEEYKVPTAADVPPIEHVAANLPDPEANPTGAKGIGEPPIVPTAAAIANAIFDAVGVRLRDAPLSRQKLLEALQNKSPLRVPGAPTRPSAGYPVLRTGTRRAGRGAGVKP
jgi:xanthine dehydrogenase YagR molybdenum-binding subunit